MRIAHSLRYLVVPMTLLSLAQPGAAQSTLGIFDGHADVGKVSRPGTAAYDPTLQQYTISGSGTNMWNARDDFHFVWKKLSGNFILSMRARFIGKGVEEHRKVGWSIRPTLATDGPHVTAALHGNGLMSLQTRRTAGAITEQFTSLDSLPDVVQLERRDGVFIMSVAHFGDTLITQQLADVSLPDTVYAGLFVCAHNDTVAERAVFSNVRITVPAKRDFVPYRDYIGSNLEILDLATGNATIVHQFPGSFQAPNWTHDGRALIYAQEGKLYRFDLATRTPTVLNTGFATRNNNDHVLSFDGTMMGISDQSVEGGTSIIYTLPATGGTPKRLTPNGPSYLHGWSPDKKWLVYTGQRNGLLDVYKIPASGGDEIRLTSTDGVDDGPEYTPDGKYIYFNSARTGRMQIWRMKPDGTAQEQVTNDAFNNWFPHFSPDGQWIVYIAFPPDIPAGDHPFYKHVTLRLMRAAGGPSRVIAFAYGGQGTINVPSWSPDGKRLAFVSNTTMNQTAPPAPRGKGPPMSETSEDTDIERLALQEERLQFQAFDAATAWTIGTTLRALAESRRQRVAIDIEVNGHQLFFAAMPGTTPDNIDWIRRKKNVVARFRRSSYAVGSDLRQQKATLTDRLGLPVRDYAAAGGCFPILIRGTGMIGTITVSGLPERSDHELVVEVLAKHLGQTYESVALTKIAEAPKG